MSATDPGPLRLRRLTLLMASLCFPVACEKPPPEIQSPSLVIPIDRQAILDSDASLLIEYLRTMEGPSNSPVTVQFKGPIETTSLCFKMPPPPLIGCPGFVTISREHFLKDDEVVDGPALSEFLRVYRTTAEMVGQEPCLYLFIEPDTPLSRLVEFAKLSALAEYPCHLIPPVLGP